MRRTFIRNRTKKSSDVDGRRDDTDSSVFGEPKSIPIEKSISFFLDVRCVLMYRTIKRRHKAHLRKTVKIVVFGKCTTPIKTYELRLTSQ